MNFIQVDVYTTSQAIDGITGLLTDHGVTGFIIKDSADFEEFLSDKNANWDYVDDELMGLKNVEPHITMYLQDNIQGAEMLTSIKSALDALKQNDTDNYYGNMRLEMDSVREEDWANNWKQYYKPFQVGDRIIIKPSWEDVEKKDGMLILEIDPASTFGTGQHHTTKLCIETLENEIKGGERVLDLGCGSGILSIAAMLLGAKDITLVDIFENAVTTASENVEKNNVAKSDYRAFCGNVIEDESLREKIGGGFDVICANIVADVIIGMSGLFTSFLKEHGTVIVSGIITERLDEVTAALTAGGLTIESIREEKDWNCILLRK